jgi:hypothetical protein
MSGTSLTELVLLHISTGAYHTAATQPVIHLTETTFAQGHCSVMLEIVGDNLALLLTYRQNLGLRAGRDTFHVYDWRSGTIKAVCDSHLVLAGKKHRTNKELRSYQ